MKTEPIPSHCKYTPTHTGLELILHLMSDLTGLYTSYFITSQAIALQFFFLSAQTQFLETTVLGPSKTFSSIVCIYQLLLMLSSHSHVCFQNPDELSCCIAIIHFLGTVNQH
jgi:hypothetical protein